LENKLTEGAPKTGGTEVTDAVHYSPTPPPRVNLGDVSKKGNISCNSNLNTCTMCVNGSVIGEDASEPVGHHSAGNYLSYADLPLPQFDDSSEVNPIFHLNQLDEFIRLRRVPKPLQLTLAFKSIVGAVGKQWVATVAHNLSDYGQFKDAFARTYWSKSKPSLFRCSLYQDKFSPRSGLSLSSYFLKYATMASYLEPRPSDGEIIKALRNHFTLTVQRAMVCTQLSTVGEALDLLKIIEMMEGDEAYRGSNPVTHHPDPIPRIQHNRGGYDRPRPNQYYARRVQYDRRNDYSRYDHRRGPPNRGEHDSPARGNGQSNNRVNSLNPHAPNFDSAEVSHRAEATDRSNQNLGN
jgi:hypothetical protein